MNRENFRLNVSIHPYYALRESLPRLVIVRSLVNVDVYNLVENTLYFDEGFDSVVAREVRKQQRDETT